jgi:hypothetical protein
MTEAHKRALVLAYYRRDWSPSHAAIHAFCKDVPLTRSEYLAILRAYVRAQDETRDLGRRKQ